MGSLLDREGFRLRDHGPMGRGHCRRSSPAARFMDRHLLDRHTARPGQGRMAGAQDHPLRLQGTGLVRRSIGDGARKGGQLRASAVEAVGARFVANPAPEHGTRSATPDSTGPIEYSQFPLRRRAPVQRILADQVREGTVFASATRSVSELATSTMQQVSLARNHTGAPLVSRLPYHIWKWAYGNGLHEKRTRSLR
jgi:hypothetical protein